MGDESTSRRTVLKLLGGGGGILGAGLLYFSTRPRVVEHEAEGQLFGETRFYVRVANDGADGLVRVAVELLDSNDEVIKMSGKKVTFPRNSTLQVALSILVPPDTDTYRVSATATKFPGNVLF